MIAITLLLGFGALSTWFHLSQATVAYNPLHNDLAHAVDAAPVVTFVDHGLSESPHRFRDQEANVLCWSPFAARRFQNEWRAA